MNPKVHPVRKGPEGGRYQVSHGEKRYLNAGKIQTGPRGGKFQAYGRGNGKQRFLLSTKKR